MLTLFAFFTIYCLSCFNTLNSNDDLDKNILYKMPQWHVTNIFNSDCQIL